MKGLLLLLVALSSIALDSIESFVYPSRSALGIVTCHRNRWQETPPVQEAHAKAPPPLSPILSNTDIRRKGSGNPVHVCTFLRASSLPSSEQDARTSTLPTSAIELIEPETKCKVVLLGCFHGTRSSADDVKLLVDPKSGPTDVIALELCATRFADLKREMAKVEVRAESRVPTLEDISYENGAMNQANEFMEPTPVPDSTLSSESPWLSRYTQMVVRTIQRRGLATGMAAAVLGGVSGLQTALSGFQPGLEFITALECAQDLNQMTDGGQIDGTCDVVLADQTVDETLRRIGNLPELALETISSPDTWKSDSDSLLRAMFGDTRGGTIPQVRLGEVLTRNDAAVRDLVRLMVPPLALLQASILLASSAVSAAQGGPFFPILEETNSVANVERPYLFLLDTLPHMLASLAIIGGAYVGLALPASRVILSERDDILTDGIKAACRYAGPGGRVVAVLGLLHVNGIAHRLLSSKEEESEIHKGVQ